MDTLIDKLNKILTNTLGYKEVLQKLSNSISDESTASKLDELAEVKEKESENLMKIISRLGGRIESSERATDQEAVSWISSPSSDSDDMDDILKCLSKAEKKSKEDYTDVLGNDEEMDDEDKQILEKHRKEASANLEYFETRLASGEQ